VIAVVELSQIVEVIWVSLVAGIGISTAYSLVVLGTARSADARRAGRSVTAFAYGTMALVFLLVFAAAVAYGVHIMLSKET